MDMPKEKEIHHKKLQRKGEKRSMSPPIRVQVQVERVEMCGGKLRVEKGLSSYHAEVLVIECCMVQVAAEKWQRATLMLHATVDRIERKLCGMQISVC